MRKLSCNLNSLTLQLKRLLRGRAMNTGIGSQSALYRILGMSKMERRVHYGRSLARTSAAIAALALHLVMQQAACGAAEEKALRGSAVAKVGSTGVSPLVPGRRATPSRVSTAATKIRIYAPEVDRITINGMTIPVGKRTASVTGPETKAIRPSSHSMQQNDIVLRTIPPKQVPNAPPRAVSVPQTVPLAPARPYHRASTLTRGLIADLRRRSLSVPISGYPPKLMRGSFYQMRGNRLHSAVDMLAPRNTPVLAVESGTIGRLFTSKAGGLTIYQKSPDGEFVYYYAHLERYAANLREGDPVTRNQVIGYVGTSGNAPPNTPHLHFAISKIDGTSVFRGTPIDPFEVYNNLSAARTQITPP